MTCAGDRLERPGGRIKRFQVAGVAVIEHVLSRDDLATMEAPFPILPAKTAGARAADFSPGALCWLSHHEGLLELAGPLAQARVRVRHVLAI